LYFIFEKISGMIRLLLLFLLILLTGFNFNGQPVPAEDENIPYLMVFGGGGKKETSWGDDDFCQTFFFQIPESYTEPFYIKVFDPDTGGDIDEINGEWDTKTSFSVYGGKECWSNLDAQETQPIGNYDSGTLMANRTFGNNSRYDNNWYTFGPFNPAEGEFDARYGNIFKIIAKGEGGDDGNLFRYYLSTSEDVNQPIEGANAFTYEYSFRMWNDPDNVSHIYPYIDERTVSVKQENFDWDSDGFIRIVSVARQGLMATISGEDHWSESQFKILDEEINTSLDFQFIKSKNPLVQNNNVVISVRNQYGELIKFYAIPIGGVPKYKYGIGVQKIEK
jgi:hypothetical protein